MAASREAVAVSREAASREASRVAHRRMKKAAAVPRLGSD
jgi:hypothetical protein